MVFKNKDEILAGIGKVSEDISWRIKVEAELSSLNYKTGDKDYEFKMRSNEYLFKWMYWFYSNDGNFDRCYGMDGVCRFLEYHGLLAGFSDQEKDDIADCVSVIEKRVLCSKLIIARMVKSNFSLEKVFSYINRDKKQ